MKRILVKFLLIAGIIISAVFIFNMPVTTQRGINYHWHSVKIPLYLKILDFLDRHYNYQQLVKTIIKGVNNGEDKVMKLFEWTYYNIRKVPEGFPVIDDHVWYTIIRGYGVDDQFSDVFTTLCNYARIEAFYSWVYTQDRTKGIPLSFVKLEGKGHVFDPYRGVYFKDQNNRLADIETLKLTKKWSMEALDIKPEIDYTIFFSTFPSIKNNELRRANIQSPFKRLIFELNKFRKNIIKSP